MQGSRVDKHISWLCASLALIILMPVCGRCLLGTEFTDESFYAALVYRFALGDAPFKDEVNISQQSALYILPFVRGFLAFRENNSGLILFLRLLHLSASIVSCMIVLRCIRTDLAPAFGLLAAMLAITCVPFNIQALSYNTFSSLSLCTALFCARASLESKRELLWAAAFWGTLAAATISHPGLLYAAGPIGILFYLHVKWPLRKFCASLVAGGTIAVLPILIHLDAGSIDNIRQMHEFIGRSKINQGGLVRVIDGAVRLGGNFPQSLIIMLPALIMASWRGQTWFVRLSLALLPLCCSVNGFHGTLRSLGTVIYLALAGPVIYLVTRRDRHTRRLFQFVWLSSFIAGCCTFYFSGNVGVNAGLGLLAAAIASLVMIVRHLSEAARDHSLTFRLTLVLFPLLALQVRMIQFLYEHSAFYREADYSQLSARVDEGPFMGLFTTPERVRLLKSLYRDLPLVAQPAESIFAYDSFVAGFLLTRLRPATISVAIFKVPETRGMLADSIRARLSRGVIALRMKGIYEWKYQDPATWPSRDPIDELVQKNFSLLIDNPQYQIYASSPGTDHADRSSR